MGVLSKELTPPHPLPVKFARCVCVFVVSFVFASWEFAVFECFMLISQVFQGSHDEKFLDVSFSKRVR